MPEVVPAQAGVHVQALVDRPVVLRVDADIQRVQFAIEVNRRVTPGDVDRGARLREDLILRKVEYVGESERWAGVVGLHCIALLAVDIGANLELVTAVNPAKTLMHDVVIVLETVVTGLVETRTDAGDVDVWQVAGLAGGRGIVASRANHGKRRIVQHTVTESMGPAYACEYVRRGIWISQAAARADDRAIRGRAEPAHIDAIFIVA